MSDVKREKIIIQIKEVAERIDIKLSDYKTKYYKEIPVASKKKICNWLEKAISETEILVFYNENSRLMHYSKVMQNISKSPTNIYNYLDNVVNEVLKYYNREFIDLLSKVICSKAARLIKYGCKIGDEFNSLNDRLEISNCISLYEEIYPDLVDLQDIIHIIKNIDSIKPGCLVPEIHELYGIKTLLLELEEMVRIIENIEDSACINIVLEYIDSLIDWNWFKDIR